MSNKHYPSIVVTFLGETEHFSGKIGALRWSTFVGKQKHNEQKPTRKPLNVKVAVLANYQPRSQGF